MKLQLFDEVIGDSAHGRRTITVTIEPEGVTLELGGHGIGGRHTLTLAQAQDQDHIARICENETVRVYSRVRAMLESTARVHQSLVSIIESL